MVVVLGFYEARKKCGLKSNTPATEIQKPVRKEYKSQANQTNTKAEEEAINSEAVITESFAAPESMPEMDEGFNESNSRNKGENKCKKYGDVYGKSGISLEDQILEIDSVLNGVDITETVGRGEAEKK